MKLRKKENKRVLKSPRDSKARNNKRIRRRNNNRPIQNSQRFARNNNPRNNERIRKRNSYGTPKQSKASKTTLIIMIIALIAFVVGAGAGISMALGSDNDGPHYENVTVEMTSNLSDVDQVYYDDENDSIDYNDVEFIMKNNLTNETLSF